MMPQDEESKHTLLQEPDEFEDIPFSEKHSQPPRRKLCLQNSLRLIFEITLVLIIIAVLIQPLSRQAMTQPGPVPVCKSAPLQEEMGRKGDRKARTDGARKSRRRNTHLFRSRGICMRICSAVNMKR